VQPASSKSPPAASPKLTDRALAEQEARRAREAAALRANLKRRRAQAQSRKPPDDPEEAD